MYFIKPIYIIALWLPFKSLLCVQYDIPIAHEPPWNLPNNSISVNMPKTYAKNVRANTDQPQASCSHVSVNRASCESFRLNLCSTNCFKTVDVFPLVEVDDMNLSVYML